MQRQSGAMPMFSATEPQMTCKLFHFFLYHEPTLHQNGENFHSDFDLFLWLLFRRRCFNVRIDKSGEWKRSQQ